MKPPLSNVNEVLLLTEFAYLQQVQLMIYKNRTIYDRLEMLED